MLESADRCNIDFRVRERVPVGDDVDSKKVSAIIVFGMGDKEFEIISSVGRIRRKLEKIIPMKGSPVVYNLV